MAKKTETEKKPAAAKAAPKTAAKASPKGTKAEPKVAKAPKEKKAAAPRHPKARVVAAHGSKEALAKSVAEALAAADQDAGQIADKLKTASNAQLLRLSKVAATVKSKYGSRDKLIAAISTAHNKSKDKDFVARLEKSSLPHLLDLAVSAERRARA